MLHPARQEELIHIYISSSSCRAVCADIPDRLSPFLPITHRLRQVFRITTRVLTQLLYVSSCWSSHTCTSMSGGPQEYIAYELVLASPAVSRVSGSSNLYSFCDGGQVSVQLESRGVLSPGLTPDNQGATEGQFIYIYIYICVCVCVCVCVCECISLRKNKNRSH